jgi:hypothetical protein
VVSMLFGAGDAEASEVTVRSEDIIAERILTDG